MRLYTILYEGREQVALSVGDGALHILSDMDAKFQGLSMNEIIERFGLAGLEGLEARRCHRSPIKEEAVELLAPIPRPKQDVICVGVNYAAHAVETKKHGDAYYQGEREHTIYFSKRVNEAVAPFGSICSHEGLVDSLDYEAELGVIIGKDALNVSVEDALDYVFGYTVINDVSARNLQTQHKQWYRGKSLDGFTPMGPCIVTADAIGDPSCLDIKCLVNGEVRQSSSTSYLLNPIQGLISELSQGMTLKAGTIIATGTPSGVGMGMDPPTFLKPGDEVECFVEAIGSIRNIIK